MRNPKGAGPGPPGPPLPGARVHADGSCIGNPGPGGIGVVLELPGGERVEVSEYLGETTNNQAEYRALLRALQECEARGVSQAAVFLDSELVVKQVGGQYRVKQADLLTLHAEVRAALARGRYRVEYVGRAENRLANVLAQKAARLGRRASTEACARDRQPSDPEAGSGPSDAQEP